MKTSRRLWLHQRGSQDSSRSVKETIGKQANEVDVAEVVVVATSVTTKTTSAEEVSLPSRVQQPLLINLLSDLASSG